MRSTKATTAFALQPRRDSSDTRCDRGITQLHRQWIATSVSERARAPSGMDRQRRWSLRLTLKRATCGSSRPATRGQLPCGQWCVADHEPASKDGAPSAFVLRAVSVRIFLTAALVSPHPITVALRARRDTRPIEPDDTARRRFDQHPDSCCPVLQYVRSWLINTCDPLPFSAEGTPRESVDAAAETAGQIACELRDHSEPAGSEVQLLLRVESSTPAAGSARALFQVLRVWPRRAES